MAVPYLPRMLFTVLLVCVCACPQTSPAGAPARTTTTTVGLEMTQPAPFLMQLHDTATREPAALIRTDWRGVAIFDLTCGDPRVAEYTGNVVRSLAESCETTHTTQDNTRHGSGSLSAGENGTTSPVSVMELTPTRTSELRQLVRERGGVGALRRFSAGTVHAWAEDLQKWPGVYSIGASGSLSGIRGRDQQLVVPRVLAWDIVSDVTWDPGMRVMLLGSGDVSSSFSGHLADLLGATVVARTEPLVVDGFSDLDAFALSDSELQALKEDAGRGDGAAAYRLSLYYDAQALQPAGRSGARSSARSWLLRSAEVNHVPAMHDLAYVLIHEQPTDLAQADALLARLKATSDYKSNESLREDVDALHLDLNGLRKRTAPN